MLRQTNSAKNFADDKMQNPHTGSGQETDCVYKIFLI